jgi:hypothetical protein
MRACVEGTPACGGWPAGDRCAERAALWLESGKDLTSYRPAHAIAMTPVAACSSRSCAAGAVDADQAATVVAAALLLMLPTDLIHEVDPCCALLSH